MDARSIKLLKDTFDEFILLKRSFEAATEKVTTSNVVGEEILPNTKLLFSKLKESIETKGVVGDLANENVTTAYDLAMDYRRHSDFFEPDFKFSDDPEKFEIEFHSFWILMCFLNAEDQGMVRIVFKDLPKPHDPRIETAIRKCLLSAGKHIGRAGRDGYHKSDFFSKIRSDTDDSWLEEPFYRVTGKTLMDMKEPIHAYLKEHSLSFKDDFTKAFKACNDGKALNAVSNEIWNELNSMGEALPEGRTKTISRRIKKNLK